MINEIKDLVGQLSEMQSLLEASRIDFQDPANILSRIQINLGISDDRDINAEIEAATEQDNIAVCQDIADKRLTRLPRELRDMVYYLGSTSYMIRSQFTRSYQVQSHFNFAKTQTRTGYITLLLRAPALIPYASSTTGVTRPLARIWLARGRRVSTVQRNSGRCLLPLPGSFRGCKNYR
jgi:hypothetical protein